MLLYDEASRRQSRSPTACRRPPVIAGVRPSRRQAETEWVNGKNIFAQEQSTPINGRTDWPTKSAARTRAARCLAFCDAHVEFVAESIEQAVLNAMLTKAGGER